MHGDPFRWISLQPGFRLSFPDSSVGTPTQKQMQQMCFCRLEESSGLCSPSMVSYCMGTRKGSGSTGQVSSACDSMLANTGMVPSVAGNACGLPTNSPSRLSQVLSTSAFSQLRLPSSVQSTAVGRMEGLRRQFRAVAIREDAIELIIASWREEDQYHI